MDKYIQGRLASQVRRCRRHVVEDQDLCFTRLLPKEQVEAALSGIRSLPGTPVHAAGNDLDVPVPVPPRPVCRAVARLFFWCVGGEDPGRAKTDPYCKARERLPEKLLADLARQSGAELQRDVPSCGLLGGRPIKIADGTTVSLPDTPENQAAYPQQRGQKPGLGFPIMRLVGLIGLSSGAVWRWDRIAVQTGETALLRQLLTA
jgi:hypothetical protein